MSGHPQNCRGAHEHAASIDCSGAPRHAAPFIGRPGAARPERTAPLPRSNEKRARTCVRARESRDNPLGQFVRYTIPWAIMASATFLKPAIFAPTM